MSTPRLAPDENFGRKLGRYELLCRLAGGGMSQIFLASRRGAAGFRKIVVLKQILPDLRGDEDFLRMFLREARITAALNHPYIAQVFDLGVDRGELFIAMEFVHGATLIDVGRALRATGHRIPIGLAAAAARDTALALQYVHAFSNKASKIGQVVHRDVAEKNVMLTFDGHAKLLDFGIAKNVAGVSRTAAGTVKGTPGYISPEQINGQPVTPLSDIFSLGVVLHQCLTDQVLFPGHTVIEQMAATLSQKIPLPSQINFDVPPELDAVVMRALERSPEQRFPSAQAFADAIDAACGKILWKPAQTASLLARLFPERTGDLESIFAMIPEEREEDPTGNSILSTLLEQSKIRTLPDDGEPWAEVIEPGRAPGAPVAQSALPPRPVPASPLVAGAPAVEPSDEQTEEATSKQAERDRVQPPAKLLWEPPPVAGAQTVSLKPGASPSPAPFEREDVPRDAPTPKEVALPSTTAELTSPLPAGAKPEEPRRPWDDATMQIDDVQRVMHAARSQRVPAQAQMLARKAAAQRKGMIVGAAIVGGSIVLSAIALAIEFRSKPARMEPVPIDPATVSRAPGSAASGGGGGRSGGSAGGGGPAGAASGSGGSARAGAEAQRGPALQKPVDPAFKDVPGAKPAAHVAGEALPAAVEPASLHEEIEADRRATPAGAGEGH